MFDFYLRLPHILSMCLNNKGRKSCYYGDGDRCVQLYYMVTILSSSEVKAHTVTLNQLKAGTKLNAAAS